MIRIFITAWLALLLVGMQQQFVVHEVDHLRAKVQRGSDTAVEKPSPGECVECELLASGSNAAPLADAATVVSVDVSTPVSSHFASSPALSPPAFYQSRGPPAVL